MSSPNVIDFAGALAATRELDPPKREPIDPLGGFGDDGGMDARLRTVENAIARIDATLPTLAQKSDIEIVKSEIHRGIVETQRWMIATVIGLFVGFGGLFLAMSNALKPVDQKPPAQPPIIINMPQAAPPTAPGQK